MARRISQQVKDQVIADYLSTEPPPSQASLAKRYGITKATVQRILKPIVYERFRKLRKLKYNLSMIAEMLGLRLDTCVELADFYRKDWRFD